jgi:hypothetical protein
MNQWLRRLYSRVGNTKQIKEEGYGSRRHLEQV